MLFLYFFICVLFGITVTSIIIKEDNSPLMGFTKWILLHILFFSATILFNII